MESWHSVLHDEHRRTFVSHKKGAFPEQLLKDWWHVLATKIAWRRPSPGPDIVLPRSAAWLTQEACRCKYEYSGLKFDSSPIEPWFWDITEQVCRACGIKDRPN